MQQYEVTGMSCAACSARGGKSGIQGTRRHSLCSVSLLTNSMGVEGSASDQAAIIAAVEAAGYGAAQKGRRGKAQSASAGSLSACWRIGRRPALKRRLLASLVFSESYSCTSPWATPCGAGRCPAFWRKIISPMGLIAAAADGMAVMVVNQRFFVSGFQESVPSGAPNMDTLVVAGRNGGSFGYSVGGAVRHDRRAAPGRCGLPSCTDLHGALF